MTKTKQVLISAVVVLVIIGAILTFLVRNKDTTQANTSINTPGIASPSVLALQAPANAMVPTTTPVVPSAPSTTISPSGLPTVNGIQYEIVTTSAAQQQGLGGRSVIPDNYAMLFVFPTDNTYGFWMKDMLVPIDMIWLSNSGQIIFIDHSVLPSSYPNVFYPPQPVKYVLETRAGFANEKNWIVGTTVALPAPY